MLIEVVICAALFIIIKSWIAYIHCRKHRRCSPIQIEMDFCCESLQKYQYLPHQELSTFISNEFDFVLGLLDKAKRWILTKPETVQRIYNLACILWQSQETSSDLTAVLKDDIYDVLVNWTFNTPHSPEYGFVKVAIDRVLCSMCSIKPDLYDRLLTRLGILPGCENAYIFRHVMPDESELVNPSQPSASIDLASINLTESMLKSLGMISLSCIPTYKLVHSKFLSVLIDLVVDFIIKDKAIMARPIVNPILVSRPPWPANPLTTLLHPQLQPLAFLPGFGVTVPTTVPVTRSQTNILASQTDVPTADNVAEPKSIMNVYLLGAVLEFFSELCWQNVLRTWLSSERNTILWEHVLHYLCIELPKSQKGMKYMLTSKPNAKSIRRLEDATINFFSKCCCGHFQNQEKFAQIFSNVLSSGVKEGADPPGVSDFTRRILLEFIASPGHIYVSIETDLPEGVNKIKTAEVALLLPPPAFPTSKRHQLLYLNVDRTCADIIKKVKTTAPEKEAKVDEVSDNNLSNTSVLDVSDNNLPNTSDPDVSDNNLPNTTILDMSWENCMPSTSKQSESSVSSSSKRSMDDAGFPQTKKPKKNSEEQSYKLMFWAPNMYQFVNVSQHWSIAEILQIFVPAGDELEVPVLKFLLSRQEETDENEGGSEIVHLSPPPAIQKFLELDGFKYIALNVEKKPLPARTKRPHIGPRSVERGRSCALNQISIHTLLAFGQFLRLPEFRNNPETKSVLQSIIGLGKETNFSSERYSRFFTQDVRKMCNPLIVLPFELLRLTFSRSYEISANVTNLDNMYAPAIDFVLMYLAVYTHQSENKDFHALYENKIYMKAIRQSYWSKYKNKQKNTGRSHWPQGVGYSSAHVDQQKTSIDFSRIEEEEELVTSLFTVLATYINPHPHLHTSSFKNYKQDICEMRLMRPLPQTAIERIRTSCLLPVIISYIKNDSIFDMVKHVPLFKAIMLVLRTIVSNVQLADMVLTAPEGDPESPGPSSESEPQSVSTLMTKLKKQIEEYLHRTRTNGNLVSSSSGPSDAADIEEQVLFEDIRYTADIIETIKTNTSAFESASAGPSSSNNQGAVIDLTTGSPLQNDYVTLMKDLLFGEYEMITEGFGGGIVFNVPYHFQNEITPTMITIPSRMKRLAMEMSSLSSSLPISHESAIFVRHDESRIDVIKALIIGPAGTPYMNGCFEFDILCPSDYPNKPIKVNFQTTGKGSVRFNPNLYNCGKVCLSLLGTWAGEQWNPKTSSILQVLVSIQGMILIPDPYFNEPGWEASRGTPKGTSASKAYNDNLLPSTVRWAMINQIAAPSACFKKIIHTHFYLKRDEIKAQLTGWVRDSKVPARGILQAEVTRLFYDLDKLTLPN